MPLIDTISAIAPLPEVSVPVVTSGSGPDVPAEVVSNDPITDIRLLASLPANLGQHLDASA